MSGSLTSIAHGRFIIFQTTKIIKRVPITTYMCAAQIARTCAGGMGDMCVGDL